MQTYEGKPDALYRGGSMVGYLDPVTLVSAMAAVTKSVSFGITGSTSYIRKIQNPLPFSLFLPKGRRQKNIPAFKMASRHCTT